MRKRSILFACSGDYQILLRHFQIPRCAFLVLVTEQAWGQPALTLLKLWWGSCRKLRARGITKGCKVAGTWDRDGHGREVCVAWCPLPPGNSGLSCREAHSEFCKGLLACLRQGCWLPSLLPSPSPFVFQFYQRQILFFGAVSSDHFTVRSTLHYYLILSHFPYTCIDIYIYIFNVYF